MTILLLALLTCYVFSQLWEETEVTSSPSVNYSSMASVAVMSLAAPLYILSWTIQTIPHLITTFRHFRSLLIKAPDVAPDLSGILRNAINNSV